MAATYGKISHISMDLRAWTTSLFRIGHVPNKLSRKKIDGGVAGLFGRPETNGLRKSNIRIFPRYDTKIFYLRVNILSMYIIRYNHMFFLLRNRQKIIGSGSSGLWP